MTKIIIVSIDNIILIINMDKPIIKDKNKKYKLNKDIQYY